MIIIRPIEPKDLESVLYFSHIPGMFNLPQDQDSLESRIDLSQKSFAEVHQTQHPVEFKKDRKFVWVAEDLDRKKIVGTSMIAAQHGTPEAPHFYFQIGQEQHYSSALGTGFVHRTLELKWDIDGPSEIGGLVVDPEYRSHSEKVGRQLSMIRFDFYKKNRKVFKNRILAELLPPINKKGKSPLWEAVGRRFTNLDYWEADKLCSQDKEFIFSLFPKTLIYTTFFSAEARNAIGKVGKDTEPVVHMLKKIGFKYLNQVDPFDGGPHYSVTEDELMKG
jgi:arginine N-succinyltransferase